MKKDKYLIWLTSIKNVGSVRVRRIIDHFGSAQNVWNADANELMKVRGINKEICNNILSSRKIEKLENHIEGLKRHSVSVITLESECYPSLLTEIYDPPYVLYAKGEPDVLKKDCIAIVGSRNASYYGRKVAFKLAGQLAKRGFVIVSGFARGIDSYAHKGAIAVGGQTIAVLGNGLDVVYPRENYSLMKEICRSSVMISEYPLGTSPLRGNFPARNRIISGLSVGTIVIEASERSGALITADFALEQNREVFAVPGNINSPTSTGTNRLIKEGAKMVNSVEDVLEELPVKRDHPTEQASYAKKDNPNAHESGRILKLVGVQPVHIEELLKQTGMKVGDLNSFLSSLEVDGYIERLPGNYYVIKE